MWQPRESRAPSRAPQVQLNPTRRVEVVRTYLTLDAPAELRASTAVHPEAQLERRDPCPVALYRRLYHDVGERWFWHERLKWTDAELEDHLANPRVAVWELLVRGESAGYFELYRHEDASVEIDYLGLTAPFIGRGLGGLMLTRAVEEAWALGATRVWLHTCTLDSPNALPGYQARGFRPYKTEKLEVDIEGNAVVDERLIHE
ncbi:MAG TPA: GNAT family N-acetyltransferase [Gemmatimonadaceae bacterium]|nr:GNAT family N-acetyltransferase [Gemmatimonadaceae bacterium]